MNHERDRTREPLDPLWIERFHSDLEEDERRERRLLVRALVIAFVVVVLAVMRWYLL
jgi:hypothetical protein